jgi:hypothetical protein
VEVNMLTRSIVAACVVAGASAAAFATQDRLAPPARVTCPRDKLTVYAGAARALTPSKADGQLTVTIDTDSNTTHVVQFPADRTAQLEWFLFQGRPFVREDFTKIFGSDNQLRKGVRVNAWVCSDSAIHPVLDWQNPPEDKP